MNNWVEDCRAPQVVVNSMEHFPFNVSIHDVTVDIALSAHNMANPIPHLISFLAVNNMILCRKPFLYQSKQYKELFSFSLSFRLIVEG